MEICKFDFFEFIGKCNKIGVVKLVSDSVCYMCENIDRNIMVKFWNLKYKN